MMKRQMRLLAIMVFLLVGPFVCEYSGSFAAASETGPNTFDADGNLCLIGGNTPQQTGTPMELWAGASTETSGILAGYITFDAQNVIINLTDLDYDGIPDMYPWVATAVHIHFAADVDGIPHTKKGNPIPGQFEVNIEYDLFEYSVEIDDPFQSVIEIPVFFDPLEPVGAIHLSVQKDYSGVDLFGDYLPEDEIQMSVVYPELGDPSYHHLSLSDAGLLDGVYDGWCVDVDQTIDNNTVYTAHLYSTYDVLPEGLFEHPENFDKINYLLNNFYAGKMVTPLTVDCNVATNCGGDLPPEELTYGDIQRAIWILIDDDLTTAGLLDWKQKRVNAVLCDVNANGEGFIPACDEETAFIVVPDDGNAQIITAQTVISSIGVPCVTEEESAWGDGKFGATFPGSNQWGKYFLYDELCAP